MLQNARVTAFTVSELLRVNQGGDKLPPTQIRVNCCQKEIPLRCGRVPESAYSDSLSLSLSLSLKYLKFMLKLQMVQLSLTCSNQDMVKHFVTLPSTHLCHMFPVSLDKSNAQTQYGIDTLQSICKTVREENVKLGFVENLLIIAF